jgi:hypothetical protein
LCPGGTAVQAVVAQYQWRQGLRGTAQVDYTPDAFDPAIADINTQKNTGPPIQKINYRNAMQISLRAESFLPGSPLARPFAQAL